MLILLLQTGRIHLPKTADSKALEQELLNYELKMKTAGGTPEMGALRTGLHDDLVTALGLGVYF